MKKIGKGYWKIPNKAVMNVTLRDGKYHLEVVNFERKEIYCGTVHSGFRWHYDTTRITKKEYFLSKIKMKQVY